MKTTFDPGELRPTLHPCCRVEQDIQTGNHSLIYPNGVVRLPVRYGILLKLCDGTRKVEEVLALSSRSCGVSVDEMRQFIREAAQKGWLVPHHTIP